MSIEKQRDEYIESLGGELTPEQAAQLLELTEGDTGIEWPEHEAQPGASADSDEAEPPEPNEAEGQEPTTEEEGNDAPAEIDESQLTPENAVILAKDGKHTIGFEKLVEARQQSVHWKTQYDAAMAELERLKAEAQERADAGEAPTERDKQVAFAQRAIEQGIDPTLFGDYSEEALAKGIVTCVQMQVEARVQEELDKRLKPLEQERAEKVAAAHFDAIYAAHPDADSIVESQELKDWIAQQPRIAQQAYTYALQQGSAQDVIEVFDAFKKASGATQNPTAPANANALKQAAKQAAQTAPRPVPASLSDFPGGRAGGQSFFEQIAGMTDGREMLDAIQSRDLTPQQLDHLLNHL